MTIEEWIEMFNAIEEGKEVVVGFQLHKGMKRILDAFDTIEDARVLFEKVRDAEAAEIKKNE